MYSVQSSKSFLVGHGLLLSDGARRVEVRSSLIYQKIVLHGIDI